MDESRILLPEENVRNVMFNKIEKMRIEGDFFFGFFFDERIQRSHLEGIFNFITEKYPKLPIFAKEIIRSIVYGENNNCEKDFLLLAALLKEKPIKDAIFTNEKFVSVTGALSFLENKVFGLLRKLLYMKPISDEDEDYLKDDDTIESFVKAFRAEYGATFGPPNDLQ